jgi:hypothetical protein
MLTKFWESAGEGLSKQWGAYLFGPAFLFWGGGLVIIVFQMGFYIAWDWIASRDVPTQVAALLVGLFIIALSSKWMEQLRFSALRLLEGYWIWPLSYLMGPASQFQRGLIERERERWNVLMDKLEKGGLTSIEKHELARLEINGHYTPAKLEDCKPTLLGNILASAEDAPRQKYGLDAVICWPRLWLVLPKESQEAIGLARQKLDGLVELWTWGLLFLIWAFWWQWAVLIAILWMVGAYFLALQAAKIYSDLLVSAFDLYRWKLYEAAHWDLPVKSGMDEITKGQQLTQFLWRGTSKTPVNYHLEQK